MTLDAAYPVALLPVRLETRFAGSLLQVRIFPDDIWADTHEPELTAEERADGNAYLAAKAGGLAAEQRRGACSCRRWTAPRAAYIAARGRPAGHRVARGELDAGSPGAAARPVGGAGLPGRRTSSRSPAAPVQHAARADPLARLDRGRPGAVSDGLSIDAALQWTVDFAAAQSAGMAVTIDLTQPGPRVARGRADPGAGVDLLVVVGVSDSQAPADGAAQLRALLDAQHYTRGLAFLQPGTPTNNTPAAPAAFPPARPGRCRQLRRRARRRRWSAPASPPGAYGVGLRPRARAAARGRRAGRRGRASRPRRRTDGDTAAAAMNDALWPATLGYCMEQLMAPEFDAATISPRAAVLGRPRAGPRGRCRRSASAGCPTGCCPPCRVDRLAADPRFTPALRALRDQYFVPGGRVRAPDHARLRRPRRRPAEGARARRKLPPAAHARPARAGVHHQRRRLARPGRGPRSRKHGGRRAPPAAAALLGTVAPQRARPGSAASTAAAVYELIGAPLVTAAPAVRAVRPRRAPTAPA